MSKQENNTIWWILIAAIAVALVFASCATPKNVTENILQNDSTNTNVSRETDTLIIRDTVYLNSTTIKDTESSEETTLHFGDGGGTFNTNTGEATNVTSVTQSKTQREHELEEEVKQWQSTAEQYRCSLDSVVAVNHQLKSDTEEEPVGMSKAERFFHTSGVVAWCFVVIALLWLVLKLLRKFKVIP